MSKFVAPERSQKELMLALIVCQAINKEFESRLREVKNKKKVSVLKDVWLECLKGFTENYFDVDPMLLIDNTRKEIADRMRKKPSELRHTDECLLNIKLSEIFCNGIPLYRD